MRVLSSGTNAVACIYSFYSSFFANFFFCLFIVFLSTFPFVTGLTQGHGALVRSVSEHGVLTPTYLTLKE